MLKNIVFVESKMDATRNIIFECKQTYWEFYSQVSTFKPFGKMKNWQAFRSRRYEFEGIQIAFAFQELTLQHSILGDAQDPDALS